MTGSRGDTGRRLIRAVVTVSVLALPAFGADDARAAGADGADVAPLGRPKALAPPSSIGDGGRRGVQPVSGGAPGSEIRVDSLEAVNIDAAGALAPGEGGLGSALWYGTGRNFVDQLLPRLPVASRSRAVRELMRRLLMTAATPPDGRASSGELIALRVRLLADMGDLEGAKALVSAVPSRSRGEHMMRREADSHLMSGETAAACGLAANQIQASEIPYWQKLLAFCQVLAGEGGKAMLGAELLREMGHDDPSFFSLLEGLNGVGGGGLDGARPLEPLHLAMAQAAKTTLSEISPDSPPGVLRAVALDESQPLGVRLPAAEAAEAKGALATLALRELYSAVLFTDDELANPLSAAENESQGEGDLSPDLRARALLFHTALNQEVAAARAEALSAALIRAGSDGRYSAAIRVLMPSLEALEPAAGLTWLAPDMVRALLVSGRIERAGAWYRLLVGNASLNPEAATAVALLKPLMYLAGALDAEAWSAHDLAAWLQAAGTDRSVQHSAGLLFSLVEGFGDFVPDGLWQRVPIGGLRDGSAFPPAALSRRLETAARLGRIGETVLLSILFLGPDGPGGVHPLVLRDVLRALRAVGLEPSAREIAVEAGVAGLS